jgi:hypothetical protein
MHTECLGLQNNRTGPNWVAPAHPVIRFQRKDVGVWIEFLHYPAELLGAIRYGSLVRQDDGECSEAPA